MGESAFKTPRMLGVDKKKEGGRREGGQRAARGALAVASKKKRKKGKGGGIQMEPLCLVHDQGGEEERKP